MSKTKKILIAIFIMLILAVPAIFLIIGKGENIIQQVIPKSSKQLFSYNIENTIIDFSKQIDNLGVKQLEVILNSNTASNQVNSTTTIALGEETFSVNQEAILNSKTGHASISAELQSSDGTSMGKSGIYFTDNIMILKPSNATEPMIRYTLSEEQKQSFKSLPALDRLNLVIQNKAEEEKVDWKIKTKEFIDTSLAFTKDESYMEGTENITILGKEEACKLLTLKVSGEQSISVFNELINLLKNSSAFHSYGSELSNANSFIERLNTMTEEEKLGAELSLSTIALKETPVGLKLLMINNGKEMSMNLICYQKGLEKQNELYLTAPENESLKLLETNILKDGDNYEGKLEFDMSNKASLIMTSTGTMTEKKENTKSIYTVISEEDETKTEITGIINYLYEDQDSTKNITTDLTFNATSDGETQMGTIKANSNQTSKDIDVIIPEFIPESGTDLGQDYEALKEKLNIDEENVENKSSIEKLFTVIMMLLSSY